MFIQCNSSVYRLTFITFHKKSPATCVTKLVLSQQNSASLNCWSFVVKIQAQQYFSGNLPKLKETVRPVTTQ